MIEHTKTLARTVALVVAGCLASCNSTIDKEPNVVLEAETVTIPPVTSTANGPNNSCTFLVTVANGTFKNKPKNQFATESPFNDIIMKNVVVSYVWDDGLAQPPVTAGIAGSVPANGSASTQFSVISNAALGGGDPATGRAGHTASLGMTFNGTTVSGDAVSTSTGGTLQVNSCTVNLGACCTPGGCVDGQSSAACTTQSGTYQGDFTTCATLPNSCP
jgi:hypothetical protein